MPHWDDRCDRCIDTVKEEAPCCSAALQFKPEMGMACLVFNQSIQAKSYELAIEWHMQPLLYDMSEGVF